MAFLWSYSIIRKKQQHDVISDHIAHTKLFRIENGFHGCQNVKIVSNFVLYLGRVAEEYMYDSLTVLFSCVHLT